MNEIPLPLIKTNQAGMVVLVLLSFGFQEPLFVYFAFLVQLISLVFGPKANLFMGIARLVFRRERLRKAETQAAELARFNQTIAVVLLGLASAAHVVGWTVAAHVFAGMVALAALVAVLGYCIGCTIYYQFKKWKLLRTRAS